MEKTNVIKISREFKDNVLGGLWLGREISIDDAADPIQTFLKANEELNEAYIRLSGGNGVERDYSFPDFSKAMAAKHGTPNPIPTIQVSKTDKVVSDIEGEIRACTDDATLMTYQKIAKSNDVLWVAYLETNKKITKEYHD